MYNLMNELLGTIYSYRHLGKKKKKHSNLKKCKAKHSFWKWQSSIDYHCSDYHNIILCVVLAPKCFFFLINIFIKNVMELFENSKHC